MKKITSLIFIFILLTSCEKKINQNEDNNKDEIATIATPMVKANCLSLKEYRKLTTVEAKADWLRKYGAAVCKDTLDKALKETHLIDSGTITTTTNVYAITWDEVETFIGENMYNAYISFDYNTNKTIENLKLIPKFDPSITCYSVPLIRYIASENKLATEDNIEFGFANIGLNRTIVIRVKGNVYYDFSNEPKSTKPPVRYPL